MSTQQSKLFAMTDDRPSELTQQITDLEAKRDRLQTEIAASKTILRGLCRIA